jgi:hypothetical protein
LRFVSNGARDEPRSQWCSWIYRHINSQNEWSSAVGPPNMLNSMVEEYWAAMLRLLFPFPCAKERFGDLGNFQPDAVSLVIL